MTHATETKERPILFSGLMVRSILGGRKTQIRRVIKPQPGSGIQDCYAMPDGRFNWLHLPQGRGVGVGIFACPYGQPGDRLWVREAWGRRDLDPGKPGDAWYRADWKTGPYIQGLRWRPSIHMPRWASRITLEIESIAVQRVQEIKPDGAIAEGATEWGEEEGQRRNYDKSGKRRNVPLGPSIFDGRKRGVPYLVNAFAELWDSINAKRGFGWKKNPWVWVVEFRKCGPSTQ